MKSIILKLAKEIEEIDERYKGTATRLKSLYKEKDDTLWIQRFGESKHIQEIIDGFEKKDIHYLVWLNALKDYAIKQPHAKMSLLSDCESILRSMLINIQNTYNDIEVLLHVNKDLEKEKEKYLRIITNYIKDKSKESKEVIEEEKEEEKEVEIDDKI